MSEKNTIDQSSSCAVSRTLNKGAWTAEEDKILAQQIQIQGPKRWKSLALNSGLNRCGKSCRLRWLNYLRPDIKRGNISDAKDDLILRLHRLLGNRWSVIAKRLPGRTDNEIKNYWNAHLRKKAKLMYKLPAVSMAAAQMQSLDDDSDHDEKLLPAEESSDGVEVEQRGKEVAAEDNNDHIMSSEAAIDGDDDVDDDDDEEGGGGFDVPINKKTNRLKWVKDFLGLEQ